MPLILVEIKLLNSKTREIRNEKKKKKKQKTTNKQKNKRTKLRLLSRRLGLVKSLRYFSNVRRNSVAPDGFAEVVKVTKYTWLDNAELAWYSLSATRRICLYCLEQFMVLGLHVLETRAKFLQRSVINYAFTFATTNLCDVMTQFELNKHKFPN